MINIGLAQIPNQTVSMRLGDNLYSMTFRTTRGVMSLDLLRDGEVLLSGSRMLPNTPLIPYRYLEGGNFVMICENGNYPTYELINISQSLVYVSAAELEALRA